MPSVLAILHATSGKSTHLNDHKNAFQSSTSGGELTATGPQRYNIFIRAKESVIMCAFFAFLFFLYFATFDYRHIIRYIFRKQKKETRKVIISMWRYSDIIYFRFRAGSDVSCGFIIDVYYYFFFSLNTLLSTKTLHPICTLLYFVFGSKFCLGSRFNVVIFRYAY